MASQRLVGPGRHLCANHPDRPGHALCMACRKIVCQECATEWDGINYFSPRRARSRTCTGLLAEVLFFALGWTLAAFPLLVLLSGLAAATFPLNERPGLVGPLTQIARHMGPGRILIGLVFVFGVAFVIAYVNLYFDA